MMNTYVKWADLRWLGVWAVLLLICAVILTSVLPLAVAMVLNVVAGYFLGRYGVVDRLVAWGERTRSGLTAKGWL